MERLQKFLSRAGMASRRHAETLIVDGRVKVNGKVITELGTRVDPLKDLVLLDGKLVSANSERKYFLLYKPPGVVTTLSDPEGRPTVADYARETGGRVFPVGRLDYDAEGALLLTDDGELANKLMHPSHQVPRVYLAKVKGAPDEPSLEKLVAGVRLEDGMAKAVEARIFDRAERNTWVKLVVTEGRQHLIKRLCAAIGHPVVRLFRPAHAGIGVQGLRPGELRELTHDEIRRVKAAADGETTVQPSLALPARRHGHAAPGFEPEPLDDDAPPSARQTDLRAQPEPVRQSERSGEPAGPDDVRSRGGRSERPFAEAPRRDPSARFGTGRGPFGQSRKSGSAPRGEESGRSPRDDGEGSPRGGRPDRPGKFGIPSSRRGDQFGRESARPARRGDESAGRDARDGRGSSERPQRKFDARTSEAKFGAERKQGGKVRGSSAPPQRKFDARNSERKFGGDREPGGRARDSSARPQRKFDRFGGRNADRKFGGDRDPGAKRRGDRSFAPASRFQRRDDDAGGDGRRRDRSARPDRFSPDARQDDQRGASARGFKPDGRGEPPPSRFAPRGKPGGGKGGPGRSSGGGKGRLSSTSRRGSRGKPRGSW